VKAIADAFDRLEKEWIQIAQTSFHNGFPKAALVGSCALISIVYNNKLYVSNCGDSKAVLLRLNDDGKSFERIKISKTFNANKNMNRRDWDKNLKMRKILLFAKESKMEHAMLKEIWCLLDLLEI